MTPVTLDILISLAAIEFARDAADPTSRDAALTEVRDRVRALPRRELIDAVMVLAERFTLAMESTREHVALLAIMEFGMHPDAVDKLNLPTIVGSLMGLVLPDVRESACCATCAFRQGSAANQCVPTVADALECVNNVEKFMCHENVHDGEDPTKMCRGWAQAVKLIREPMEFAKGRR